VEQELWEGAVMQQYQTPDEEGHEKIKKRGKQRTMFSPAPVSHYFHRGDEEPHECRPGLAGTTLSPPFGQCSAAAALSEDHAASGVKASRRRRSCCHHPLPLFSSSRAASCSSYITAATAGQ
jgi:hypothetical protein